MCLWSSTTSLDCFTYQNKGLGTTTASCCEGRLPQYFSFFLVKVTIFFSKIKLINGPLCFQDLWEFILITVGYTTGHTNNSKKTPTTFNLFISSPQQNKGAPQKIDYGFKILIFSVIDFRKNNFLNVSVFKTCFVWILVIMAYSSWFKISKIFKMLEN